MLDHGKLTEERLHLARMALRHHTAYDVLKYAAMLAQERNHENVSIACDEATKVAQLIGTDFVLTLRTLTP